MNNGRGKSGVVDLLRKQQFHLGRINAIGRFVLNDHRTLNLGVAAFLKPQEEHDNKDDDRKKDDPVVGKPIFYYLRGGGRRDDPLWPTNDDRERLAADLAELSRTVFGRLNAIAGSA